MKPVFDYIDHNQHKFIDRLIDYLRRPSISAYGIGMDEVADYLIIWLTRLGFKAQLMPTPGWPMVLGHRFDRPVKPTVLLYGHYDVQPPEPLEAWISPPFVVANTARIQATFTDGWLERRRYPCFKWFRGLYIVSTDP